MQKVIYSISKVNKDEKLKGVGYLVEGNLLIPSTSQKGNAYIRVFEDIAEKCKPVKDSEKLLRLFDMSSYYWQKWFSDYLYIKNISEKPLTVKTRNNLIVTLNTNGVLILNFGKYTEECSEHSTGVKIGLTDEFTGLCENLDWYVKIYETEIEFEKYSPEGEDFLFYVSPFDISAEVQIYAENFDADEHAEMWIESRGVRGVPSSIRDLINDADAIQKMLTELSEQINHFTTDIKPIPKYMLKLIEKADKKERKSHNGFTRFYAYFTKYGGELVKVTVACKNRGKKWFCKQVAVHGIHSKYCLVKDFNCFMIRSYVVGWYKQGPTQYSKWWETHTWEESDDKCFNVYAPILNKEYLNKFPEYRYSAVMQYPYLNVFKYLRLYEKYPQGEMLVKFGLSEYATSKQILQK